MLGIMVSAIASRVVHWDAVRTSPAGGGGRGLSRGARRLSCVLVIFVGSGG